MTPRETPEKPRRGPASPMRAPTTRFGPLQTVRPFLVGLLIIVAASAGLTILGFLKRDVAPNRVEKARAQEEGPGSATAELLRAPLRTYPALSAAEMGGLKDTVAVVETDFGRFAFEFCPEVAPESVQNFVRLVKERFYDLQLVAGGVAGDGIRLDGVSEDPKHAYRIKAEFSTLPVEVGTVLLERATDPGYVEGLPEKADYLNSGSTTVWVALGPKPEWAPNYTVFGKVIAGLDVIRELSLAFTQGFPDYIREVLVYRVRLVSRAQLLQVLAQPLEEPQHIPWAPQRSLLPPG